MPTINATLDMAKRALLAQQGSMATGGENVANVNTPGYARRKALLRSAPTHLTDLGGYGSGVEIYAVVGLRDRFVEQQYHRSLGEFGWYETSQEHLRIVEGVVGDLGEASLIDAIDRFWNSWHDLASDPTSIAGRTVVRERSIALGKRFQDMDNRLAFHREQINAEISAQTAEVNDIIRQLGRLNIESMKRTTPSPLLEDNRNQLLDRLARLANVHYQIKGNGTVNVHLDSIAIVMGKDTQTIDARFDDNNQIYLVVKDAGDLAIKVNGGELGALFDVRDQNLDVLNQKLDDLTVSLVDEVNRIHRGGYGLNGGAGRDFFDSDVTGLGDLKLSAEILNDIENIAASADGMPGDNRIALAIAELDRNPVLNEGRDTINQAYQESMSWLGERVAENDLQAEGARLSYEQMEIWRDSISGVSLDEEMAEMIRFQHAFNAAAKIVGAADTIMQTVIAMIR